MNTILIFAVPNKQEVEALVKEWVKGIEDRGNYMGTELGKGPYEGSFIHVVFNGIDQIDHNLVHYSTRIYPVKLKATGVAGNNARDLTGDFSIVPAKRSIWDFLEYKDSQSSVTVPSSQEVVECTLREYFLNGRLCAISIFNALEEARHFSECNE